MARFLEATMADMKGGRESWRVHVTLAIPSLAATLALLALANLW